MNDADRVVQAILDDLKASAVADVDLVIPAYNEERRIRSTVESVCRQVAAAPFTARIVVVDNGSVDATAEAVDRAASFGIPVTVISCSAKGKGAAVRAGVAHATAPYVGYIDADESTPAEALVTGMAVLQSGWDVAVGSRRATGASYVVPQSRVRRLGSRAFNLAATPIVGRISDTQCGMKLFRTAAVKDVFEAVTTDGFAFDVEVLARARTKGLRIMEVPVRWSDSAGSSFRPVTDGIRAFRELGRLRRVLSRPTHAPSSTAGEGTDPDPATRPGAAPARDLLVITNWRDLDHPEGGGAEVVCHELATRLVTGSQDVVLLCAAVKGRPSVEVRDGYTIVRAGSRFTVYPFALLWLLRNRDRVTAVVDSQNGIPFFTPLAVRRTTPVLLLLHHIHQEQFAKYFSPGMAAVGRWLESAGTRMVYRRRAIITVSPSTRHGARRTLRLRGQISVTPPGWSVTESVRLRHPHKSEHPSVVCVGRLVPHKRTHLVVEAFPTVVAQHPTATLTIVGRGPEAPALKDLVDRLGLSASVSFRDDLDDEQRDRTVADAWLTVNASQGEGWGLSVVEANALGVPAMAFRAPGLRDSIVPGETGWLLDHEEDLGVTIAARLGELSDPGHARQMAEYARGWASQFTWDRMRTSVLAALETETSRLNHGDDDRRSSSDVATVVTIAVAHLPEDWRSRLRGRDVYDLSSQTLTVFCQGADTQTVRALLHRLSIEDPRPDDKRFAVSVARTSDLLRYSSRSTPSADDALGAAG